MQMHQAAELYREGKSRRQVAEHFGVSANAVRTALRCAGVPARSRLHGVRLRHGVPLEYNGQRLTISQWAQRLGVPYPTLRSRYQIGKPVAQILGEPACRMEIEERFT
jgi:hypothetical protein